MFLVIDNYDSFTYNLVHYFQELGAPIEVVRNDAVCVSDVLAMDVQAVVLSPGPGRPEGAGICLPLIEAAADKGLPLLGVCLGHQSLGQAFGGRVVSAPTLMHGKVSSIDHDGSALFGGLPRPFDVTRYHSLIVERSSLPACFNVTAWTEDGIIMAMEHQSLPLYGVQFHPESIATQYGHALLANFMKCAGATPLPLPLPISDQSAA